MTKKANKIVLAIIIALCLALLIGCTPDRPVNTEPADDGGDPLSSFAVAYWLKDAETDKDVSI